VLSNSSKQTQQKWFSNVRRTFPKSYLQKTENAWVQTWSATDTNMKVSLVIASVHSLENVKAFEQTLTSHECKVVIIDEGENAVRKRNEKMLSNIPHEHYGPREREEWFKKRFKSAYRNLLSVVPKKCHAETSFGFLVAYEEKPDIVVEIDDDAFPLEKHALLDAHIENLLNDKGVTVSCKGKWYNTMENLNPAQNIPLFPRGHPYGARVKNEDFIWINNGGKCVLNMGLWAGCPDFDALTILYNYGLNGRCSIEGKECKREKIVVGKGAYFSVCSMNTAFLPEIIPAFYQLYMNFMGIDRFDDIWSGIFLKKIVDHLGRKVCLGVPMIDHRKRPRDTFEDLQKEIEGMIINEKLWTLVDQAEIEGSTYWEAYNSLILELEKVILKAFNEPRYRKFLNVQLQKMRLWLKIIDRLT